MNILLFGIAEDIVGKPMLKMDFQQEISVLDLKKKLIELYPSLQNLASIRIAVNNSYAEEGQLIRPKDEIALIPPVSGG